MLEVFFNKQPSNMCKMFEFVDIASKISKDKVEEERKKLYEWFIENSGYVKEICTYLIQ